MRKALFLFCIAASAIGSAPGPARAQVPSLPPPPPAVGDTSLTATLRLAGAYLDAGQPERAIPLLEDLLAGHPSSYPVYARLREAYAAARRFDELVALADSRIAAAGASPSLLAERGAALFQAGRPDEAAAAWSDALAGDAGIEMTYRLVADAQGALGLYAEAAATLALGRVRLSDPTRFRAETAHLHGLAGDTESAGDEWFALLEENPGAESLVRTRLTRLLAGESAGPLEGGSHLASPSQGLGVAAARAVRRAPLNRAVREAAAWLAMQRGDWQEALDGTIAIDRLESEEGQGLVAFGETAAAAGAMQEAQRAFAIVLERHADGAAAPLARLGMAEIDALRSEEEGERAGTPAPRAQAAVEGLVAFAESQPGHPRGARALRTAARLSRSVLADPAESERLLRAAAARPAVTPAEAAAIRLDLARLALSAGSLAEARALFTAVEETERIGDAAEAARLELAYLDFYAGDTAGALARAQAMDANTGADVANDALLLRLLLTENVDADSSTTQLAAYARAALRVRQGRAADAVVAIDSLLAGAARHPVADDAAFLRALALRAAGRTQDALASLGAFPERYSDSYLVERARFLVAEVLERDVRDLAAARASYDDFLQSHPRSVLAPEARARLRRLSDPG